MQYDFRMQYRFFHHQKIAMHPFWLFSAILWFSFHPHKIGKMNKKEQRYSYTIPFMSVYIVNNKYSDIFTWYTLVWLCVIQIPSKATLKTATSIAITNEFIMTLCCKTWSVITNATIKAKYEYAYLIFLSFTQHPPSYWYVPQSTDIILRTAQLLTTWCVHCTAYIVIVFNSKSELYTCVCMYKKFT